MFDLGNDFMEMTPKAEVTKTQIDKWDYSKENNSKKRQPMVWEKIFANHSSDKGLISKLYNELLQVNSKITNKSNLKMG